MRGKSFEVWGEGYPGRGWLAGLGDECLGGMGREGEGGELVEDWGAGVGGRGGKRWERKFEGEVVELGIAWAKLVPNCISNW